MNKNSEIRRRKQKDDSNRPPGAAKRRPKHKPTGIPFALFSLIISGGILTCFMIFYADQFPWQTGHKTIDNIVSWVGYHEPVYAVVLDAGSTGSRVTAFTFHKAFLNRDFLVLDKELFVHTKPGLSAFADNPEQAVESIKGLVEQAKQEIPEKYWNDTRIILKATAGLRLLPTEKAEGLLKAIRKYFKELPFQSDNKAVEIMDGTDEGIFSWFSVNFLLNNINNPVKTVAALDLGGGSTQITFAAQTPATLKQKEFIHSAQMPYGKTPVFTNSYLGLGLMAARKEILTVNGKAANNKVISPCVNPLVKDKRFHYGGVDYFVSGLQENYPTAISSSDSTVPGTRVPIVDFEECSNMVRKYVKSKMEPPSELANKKIFAFSYYYDRASDAGLIQETVGGMVTINSFRESAEKFCKIANKDQPFLCLDLTFIAVLLEDGMGLAGDTNIYLLKKIRKHEVSWALGAAYDMLKG